MQSDAMGWAPYKDGVLQHGWRRRHKCFKDFVKKEKPRALSIAIGDWVQMTVYRSPWKKMGCPRGVMVKAMNCGIVVREFVLQSRYYVHFRANTLGKDMNPLILPPAMGK